ncbi:hypothetical protein C1645_879970 [Glomus cerebriforme]|uniref:Uncharacterized protein n=1 Tax=Glomus cerebriforme TaxID=658196 RepID=A0A397SEE9_9GLOM|nr:hypothetical protein C1645_879970 [Glomus cerebriforme]
MSKSKAQETAGDTEDEITEIVAQKNVINVEEEIASPKADPKLSPGEALLKKLYFWIYLIKEGKKEGRKSVKEKFYVSLVIGLVTVIVAALINTQDANIIKYGTLLLNSIVYGTQLLWAGVEAVRESSDKKLIYYSYTLLPLLFGTLAPIFLGKFLVTIPPTVSLTRLRPIRKLKAVTKKKRSLVGERYYEEFSTEFWKEPGRQSTSSSTPSTAVADGQLCFENLNPFEAWSDTSSTKQTESSRPVTSSIETPVVSIPVTPHSLKMQKDSPLDTTKLEIYKNLQKCEHHIQIAEDGCHLKLNNDMVTIVL